jgi:hypothetical protein
MQLESRQRAYAWQDPRPAVVAGAMRTASPRSST